MHPLETMLAEHPFFAGLDPAIIKTVAGCGKQMRFEKGDYLFRQGDPADTFYVLRHGHVGLELRGAKGAVLFHTNHDGDILNPAWIVPPYRCGSDARALDTSIAVALDGACLRGKCEADNHLGYQLMKRFVPVLIERLMDARVQALDIYGGSTA